MLPVIVGAGIGLAAAAYVYLVRERVGLAAIGLTALRATAFGALVLLVVDPTLGRGSTEDHPVVLLDGSLSMQAAGGHWADAVDTAVALARGGGSVLRFGAETRPNDSLPPTDGESNLLPALRAAVGRGGPIDVVTDGAITDGLSLPPALRDRARVVLVRRDTMSDAALLDAAIDDRVAADDSVRVAVQIGTWGALPDSGQIDVLDGTRRLARRTVRLPRAPGVSREVVVVPPRALAPGTHVLTVALAAAGDREPRDDRRERVVTVTDAPTIVVLVAPGSWEGKFLVRELADLAQAPLAAYSRVGERWIDMRTGLSVPTGTVDRARRGAAVEVTVGDATPETATPSWRWIGASADDAAIAGDWYLAATPGVSPVAGRLAGVVWDSLPPLEALTPVRPSPDRWVALAARLGRGGAERPVVLGGDSAGVRRLVTTGAGLWRWALRGGDAREAYRQLLASGLDWLLASDAAHRGAALTASPVVERGRPLIFRWHRDSVPDGMAVRVVGPRGARVDTLRFAGDRSAELRLDPGTYRWALVRSPAIGGIAVVEAYSDEWPPAEATIAAGGGTLADLGPPRGARERWAIFVVVLAALVAEWAWRTRKGLP